MKTKSIFIALIFALPFVCLGQTKVGTITGEGITGYIPKFTSASSIGNSIAYDYNGFIGINTIRPVEQFQIGDLWTFHNGGVKVIGYNFDYVGGTNGSVRIADGAVSILKFGEGGISMATADAGHANDPIKFNQGFEFTTAGNIGLGTPAVYKSFVISRNYSPVTHTGEEACIRLQQITNLAQTSFYNTVCDISMNKSSGELNFNMGSKFYDATEPNYYIDPNTSLVLSLSPGGAFIKGYLHVNGSILAEEITIESFENWKDFVFDEDYSLLTLNELEKYINQNGHLPDIPSAKEVLKNGIKLGEMNANLLQKIEELTLYLIEQNKTIEKMGKRIQNLESTE